MAGRKKLGQILIEKGVIDEYQLKSALSLQKQWGGLLGKVMIDNRFVSPQILLEALHEQTGIEIAHLTGVPIPAYLLKLVPVDLAEKLRAIPIGIEGETGKPTERLVVAMSKPTNLNFLDELRFRSGKRITPKLASDHEIEQAIQLHYYGQPVESEVSSPAYSEQIQFGGREIEIDDSGNDDLDVVQGRLQSIGKNLDKDEPSTFNIDDPFEDMQARSKPDRNPIPSVDSDPFADLDVITSEPDPLDLSQPGESSADLEFASKTRSQSSEPAMDLDAPIEDVDLDDLEEPLEPAPATSVEDFDLDDPELTEFELPDTRKQRRLAVGLDEADALEDLEILEEIEPLERPSQTEADRSAELLADKAIPPPEVASVDTSDFDLDSVLAPLSETEPSSQPTPRSEPQDTRTVETESSSSPQVRSEPEASVIVDPSVSAASELLKPAQDDWEESTMELDRSAPQIMQIRQDHLPDINDLDEMGSFDDRLDSLDEVDEEEIETREFDLKGKTPTSIEKQPSKPVESIPSVDRESDECIDSTRDSQSENQMQPHKQQEESDLDDWVVFEEVEDSAEMDAAEHPPSRSVDAEPTQSSRNEIENDIKALLTKDPTLHVLIELLIRKGLISRHEILQAMQEELQKK